MVEVTVTDVSIAPNPSLLTDPIKITIDFKVSAPLTNAHWKISYLVDVASKKGPQRHVVDLGESKSASYAADGKVNQYIFEAESINVASLSPQVLLNVGLFQTTLFEGDKEIIEIKYVTQIKKNKDGALERIVFSPL